MVPYLTYDSPLCQKPIPVRLNPSLQILNLPDNIDRRSHLAHSL